MEKIENIDKNFKVETSIKREGLIFHEITEAPFTLHGVFREGNGYVRMPDAVAKSVSAGVHILSKNTAGGRLRFTTDSPYLAIKTVQPSVGSWMPHITLAGMAGFDLYCGRGKEQRYLKTLMPPSGINGGYETVVDLPRGEKELTLNFPLYHDVNEIYIGLMEGCVLKKSPDYAISEPIVYYGSSITQGGCASRPGTCYQAYHSRRYDADYINLGFSGNAKGEDVMADYIAGLSMSAFVYDYDFNTPSAEHLRATHERMFLKIREAHPELPIIILSRPNYALDGRDERFAIIRATYENAIARGDKNVYHVQGNELMAICGGEGTVDGTHPTDFGFYSMAMRIAEEMDKIFL